MTLVNFCALQKNAESVQVYMSYFYIFSERNDSRHLRSLFCIIIIIIAVKLSAVLAASTRPENRFKTEDLPNSRDNGHRSVVELLRMEPSDQFSRNVRLWRGRSPLHFLNSALTAQLRSFLSAPIRPPLAPSVCRLTATAKAKSDVTFTIPNDVTFRQPKHRLQQRCWLPKNTVAED